MKKQIAAVVSVICLSLSAGCGSSAVSKSEEASDQKQLILYTSHKAEVYTPIVREFEQRTGIYVDVHAGGTAEMLDAISSGEKADVMFGGGVETYASCIDRIEPYVSTLSASLDKTYASPQGTYTLFSELPLVFIYNNKLVDQSRIPNSWSDFFNPEWKGKIAFADPHKSGTSYTILAWLITRSGRDQNQVLSDFIAQLDGDLSGGSGEVIKDVNAGKKLIGITLEESALKAVHNGADIGMTYPEDGTCAVPDGSFLLKDAPHRDNAEKFIDFTISYDVQRMLVDTMYRRSVRTDAASAQMMDNNISISSFNISWASEHQQEIQQEWDKLNQ